MSNTNGNFFQIFVVFSELDLLRISELYCLLLALFIQQLMCKKSKPSFFPIWHNIICTLFLASIFPALIGIYIFFDFCSFLNISNKVMAIDQITGIKFFKQCKQWEFPTLCALAIRCAMGPKLHGMEFCTNAISEYYFFRFLACSPLADKVLFIFKV